MISQSKSLKISLLHELFHSLNDLFDIQLDGGHRSCLTRKGYSLRFFNFYSSHLLESLDGLLLLRDMVQTIISVDLNKSPQNQPIPGLLHNRWHPQIPPVVKVKPNQAFRVECFDWTGKKTGLTFNFFFLWVYSGSN